RILVAKDGKYAYIDQMGNEKIPFGNEFNPEVIAWGTFDKGVVKIKKHKLMGLIDTTGQKLLPAIFEDLKADYSELIPVKKRGLWGYCDKNVNLVIKYQYNEVSPFFKEKAFVKKDGFYGLIDKTDHQVVPFVYDEIDTLECGLVKVKKEGLLGIIDYNNEMLFEPSCREIVEFDKQFLQLKYDSSMTWYNAVDRKTIWTSNSSGQ
ncbi:MAG TPA: hypothetical protein DCX54_13225, partial [Flavobacteriales bacterium]|nr:hypothetical protein [Flavobacteriales bacterium]